MKKKITFLTGAGCEGAGQLGLPVGAGFKKDTILAKGVVDLIYSINQKTGSQIKNGTIIAQNSTSILYQTIMEHGIENLVHKPDESSKPDESDKTIFKNYLNIDSFSSEDQKEIRKKFKSIYRNKFYDVITDDAPEETLSDPVRFFLEKACFYSAVDSLFNHLRKPEQYKTEVNRVIKLYFSAFQSIIKKLFNEKEKMEYEEILKSKATISEKRNRLSALILHAQERIAEENAHNDNVYYHSIRALSQRPDLDVSLITTNYTIFAEKLTGLDKSKIAYLHGRLDLFEAVQTKRVAALSEFAETDLIFPFIFIQSGVKPIVNSLQIREFAKAVSAINDSDELHIIGYGINSDDEHITNLLRERLYSGKKIIIYLHGDNKKDDDKKKMLEELGYMDCVEFKSSADFNEILRCTAEEKIL